MIAVYSENHMKSINIICEQNATLLNVKAGGKHTYHCALKASLTSLMPKPAIRHGLAKFN
jgi:hypothetical protein